MTNKPGFFNGRPSVRVTLDLPMPPSTNALWRHAAGGKAYKSEAYSGWLTAAGWELKRARPASIPGCVAVRVRAAIPTRRRDLDNVLKPLLDLLQQHNVIEDDAEVAAIDARWDRTVAEGRVIIEVRTSVPPAHRMTQPTREKITAANQARRGREAAA